MSGVCNWANALAIVAEVVVHVMVVAEKKEFSGGARVRCVAQRRPIVAARAIVAKARAVATASSGQENGVAVGTRDESELFQVH